MDTTTVFLALLIGAIAGLAAGWFLFSKGKKISSALQSQINDQERALAKLEAKLNEARGAIKTAETEARAAAKEILSEAKIQASEMEAKMEKEQGRLEEKEKGLDEKVKEVEKQRAALATQEEEVSGLKAELTDASKLHREALENAQV
jgi:chromosome segregation ATPase